MKKIIWIVVVIIIAAGGYWFWMSEQNSTMPMTQPSTQMGVSGSPDQGNMGGTATSTPQQPQGDGTSVSDNLALGTDSKASLGVYLTSYNGMTLYTYAKDTAGVSTCTGTCAQTWPPYTVPVGSTLNLQAGVNGTIGTIVRADGTTQVTYNGMPLYFYAGDKTGSDTNGQGVGGVWMVAKP